MSFGESKTTEESTKKFIVLSGILHIRSGGRYDAPIDSSADTTEGQT